MGQNLVALGCSQWSLGPPPPPPPKFGGARLLKVFFPPPPHSGVRTTHHKIWRCCLVGTSRRSCPLQNVLPAEYARSAAPRTVSCWQYGRPHEFAAGVGDEPSEGELRRTIVDYFTQVPGWLARSAGGWPAGCPTGLSFNL